jgi:hypothetical protein
LTDPFSSVAGNNPSDYRQPFLGSLADFSGRTYSDPVGTDILDVLAGSGGGTWLDISGTGLAKVGYIRFSVLADPTPGVDANFELDAVSISHAALGTATVPEPAAIVLAAMGTVVMQFLRRRDRRDRCHEG